MEFLFHKYFFGKLFEDLLLQNERIDPKEGQQEIQETVDLIQRCKLGKFQEASCARGLEHSLPRPTHAERRLPAGGLRAEGTHCVAEKLTCWKNLGIY